MESWVSFRALYHAPSGSSVFRPLPRALPWAGISRPFRAGIHNPSASPPPLLTLLTRFPALRAHKSTLLTLLTGWCDEASHFQCSQQHVFPSQTPFGCWYVLDQPSMKRGSPCLRSGHKRLSAVGTFWTKARRTLRGRASAEGHKRLSAVGTFWTVA